MSEALFVGSVGGTPFTSGTSLQTAILVRNGASDFGLQIKKFRISFTGVTASNPPVLVRAFTTDNTSNGTSTAVSITQSSGRVIGTTGTLCVVNFSVEPTNKTYLGEEFLLTPNGGTLIYDYPYGDEPDLPNNSSFGLEITPSAAVGVLAAIYFTRI